MLKITHYHMQEADVITKVKRDEKKKGLKKEIRYNNSTVFARAPISLLQ